MKDITVLWFVHDLSNPIQADLAKQSLTYLERLNYPYKMIASSKTDLKILKPIYKDRPNFIDIKNGGEWKAVSEAYADCQTKYVAIHHSDDFWIRGKLEHQLKYIKSVPLVCCSYLHTEPNYMQIMTTELNSEYGLINCMPSTWLLNKELLPEIPDVGGHVSCRDLRTAITICQDHPLEVIRQPYVIYNNHAANQWNAIGDAAIEQGRAELRKLAKELKEVEIRYRWD